MYRTRALCLGRRPRGRSGYWEAPREHVRDLADRIALLGRHYPAMCGDALILPKAGAAITLDRKTIAPVATVAVHSAAREVSAARDVLHQRLGVTEVRLAVPERASPVGPAVVELAVEGEQLQRHDRHDFRLGAAVNQ